MLLKVLGLAEARERGSSESEVSRGKAMDGLCLVGQMEGPRGLRRRAERGPHVYVNEE